MTLASYSRASFLIDQGEHDKAVRLLKTIVDDATSDRDTKADALQLLGTMTQVDPTAVGDDYALPYYKRALDLCPDHLWALFGIVATYGEHAPDHQDSDAVRDAIDKLIPRLSELPTSAADTVGRKSELLESSTLSQRRRTNR